MICPRCNREYDKEFDHCLVCNVPLTEYTSILDEEDSLLTPGETEQPALADENLPELLVTVIGEQEARETVDLLQGMNIPCLCRKNQEGEDWFDLLVPACYFNDGFALLEQMAQAEEQPDDEELPDDVEQPDDGAEQPDEDTENGEQPRAKKWYEFWK